MSDFFEVFLRGLRMRLRTKRLLFIILNKMNKKLPILLLTPFLLFSLSSCSDVKGELTYGLYFQQTIFNIIDLDNETLVSKTKDEKETFLLATYQGSYSEDCLCWSTFENVIAAYMNKYHAFVYEYDAQKQDETIKNLKIEKINESTPMLYVFQGQKQLAKYSYKNTREKSIFEDTTAEAMNSAVKKVVNLPEMYYVSEEFLDENIKKSKECCVLFMRSGCGDCSYVLPNVIIPYINKHELAKDIWLFDMQYLYDIALKEDASEEEKQHYQAIKDKFGLSDKNTTFGYRNGVVPTLQYYKSGELVGATVYFNDTIEQKENGSFYIADSYYSEERLPNLKYLKGYDFPTVLKGMEISDGVLQNKKGGYYWSQEAASKYHTPILEAFLDYYMF